MNIKIHFSKVKRLVQQMKTDKDFPPSLKTTLTLHWFKFQQL